MMCADPVVTRGGDCLTNEYVGGGDCLINEYVGGSVQGINP